MAGPDSRRTLRGRERECEELDRVVDDVRSGRSRVLVLRGEAGIGKTALLDELCERASGCRVVRAAGVEAELELPFAGLHQLLSPLLQHLPRLPDPQAEALGVAFGLCEGGAPERFLVGLAVLTLLSEAAEEQPLVCVVDDVQWLDHASRQALVFAARRLVAESVAVVFAVREPGAEQLAGLPEIELQGLPDRDAGALLESAVTGPLDERVRDRIVAETRGNPLALLELPRGLSPAQMAGGFGLPDAPTVSTMIEDSFVRRLTALPAPTRRLLLVASAEPLGDPVLLFRAADRLGIDGVAAEPAAAAGLVDIGARVRFGHPLMRSAVYHAASTGERRDAHRVLAEATDPVVDPDRYAWHRARAVAGLDEGVAGELERSAGRAQARGGLAAGAAFLERAAELTPEPALRAERALAAASAKQLAGAPEAALRMLAVARTGPLDEFGSARADLLRAQIAFATTRGRDAAALLLRAAGRLEPFDASLARETYLDAFQAALSAGRLGHGGGVREVAEAVRKVVGAGETPDQAWERMLDGLAVLATDGYAAGAPELKRALRALDTQATTETDTRRLLWFGCLVSRAIADDAGWDELTDRQIRLARRSGALSLLPVALAERFNFELLSGDLAAASALAVEVEAVVESTGSPVSLVRNLWLAAWQGREDEVVALIESRRREVLARGEGQWLIAVEWLSALLYNGLGRYAQGLPVTPPAAEHPRDIGLAVWVLPELVEAAVRSGNRPLAAEPLRRLEDIADACGTDWALGLAARCGALLSKGDIAERRYRDAIDRLGRTRIRSALARAHLLYGEWLRRERRRVDAREHLRVAHEMLTAMGAEGFAERARRELLATGETAPGRGAGHAVLTAQERQIAHLAAEGRTNPEIGTQLFLSARTVEWHLGKVFTKLRVTSRHALRDAL